MWLAFCGQALMAWGHGVSDEDTITRHLERFLTQRYPDLDVQMLNGGMPGYGTANVEDRPAWLRVSRRMKSHSQLEEQRKTVASPLLKGHPRAPHPVPHGAKAQCGLGSRGLPIPLPKAGHRNRTGAVFTAYWTTSLVRQYSNHRSLLLSSSTVP